MSEPMPDDRLQEIRAAYEKVSGVFGTDWPLDYDYEWPEVVCRYEDEDAPFTNVWIELFTTGQRPDLDADKSPLAEWLAGSIKVVPALLAEVDRLRAAVDLLGRHLQGESLDLVEIVAENARLKAELAEREAHDAPIAAIAQGMREGKR